MMRGQFARKCWRLVLTVIVVSGVNAQVGESRPRRGVPEDWTHHHILFPLELLRNHPEIASREPRAIHQLYRQWRSALVPGNGLTLNAAGKSSSSGDWNVNVGGTLAFGTYPAKWQIDPNVPPSCTADFVVFGLNVKAVTGGQPSLVGFNQLYTGPNGMGGLCAGNGPNPIFSYNTTTLTNGRFRTSPVISIDGTKIAFIESSATGSAVHVLQWGTTGNNGAIFASVVPGASNNAVMTTINYSTANNNHSSPWIDYTSDILYVGADDGKVYKVTGVFKGTPTLVTTGWPIKVSGVGQVTGPVFDPTTGNIFIGDSRGVLHSFNALTPGAVTNLAVGKVGNLNPAIIDAPIVDGYGSVFATASNDGTSAVVVQASTATLTQTARVNIGVGSTTGTSVTIYDGNFDNAYFISQNTGRLLFCGTSSTTTAPFRYRMTFAGGVLQADPAPVQISASTTARCGPVTENFNPTIAPPGGTDYFFWGVTNTCVGATGCIMSFANGSTVMTAAETGGTSAVIVDNNSTTSQASSIYFANEGGPLRVVKATQSGLN